MGSNVRDQGRLRRGPFGRFQYSVRWLLILVVLVSIGMGWFGMKMRDAERQRKAAEAIRRLGGVVRYGWQLNGQMEPPIRVWVQNLLGVESFDNIVAVSLNNTHVKDADLTHLEHLTQLAILRLDGTQVTDAGLEYVKSLNELGILWLSDTRITDAGLTHLRGLSQLQVLLLTGTRVTDGGLDHLAGLVNLEVLQVVGTEVTQQGLEKLQRALPHCNCRINRGSR